MTKVTRLPAVVIILLLAAQVPIALILSPPWAPLMQLLSLLGAFVWLLGARDQKVLVAAAGSEGSESVEAVRCMANRQLGTTWVGGFLRETSGSLQFRPNALERLLRRQRIEIPAMRILDAGSVPCMPSPFGGVANCLEVKLTNGEVELFRVWKPDEQARRVRRLAASARRPGEAGGSDPLRDGV